MADIKKWIVQLQSDNPNKRYEACEELRVASSITDEAMSALLESSRDPDPNVADAAQMALKIQKNQSNVITQVDKTKSKGSTRTTVIFGLLLTIGLFAGYLYGWLSRSGRLTHWENLGKPPGQAAEIIGVTPENIWIKTVSNQIYVHEGERWLEAVQPTSEELDVSSFFSGTWKDFSMPSYIRQPTFPNDTIDFDKLMYFRGGGISQVHSYYYFVITGGGEVYRWVKDDEYSLLSIFYFPTNLCCGAAISVLIRWVVLKVVKKTKRTVSLNT